jgi:hypothetical protein
VYLDLSQASLKERRAFMRKPHASGIAYVRQITEMFNDHPNAENIDLGNGIVITRLSGNDRYAYRIRHTYRGGLFGLSTKTRDVFLNKNFEHTAV